MALRYAEEKADEVVALFDDKTENGVFGFRIETTSENPLTTRSGHSLGKQIYASALGSENQRIVYTSDSERRACSLT